ncbi:MAG: GntR family transcriptional regulator [Saprospiraceae bacterium]|nr:GntR family transcriptional regulator [Saprospiraceae bacterium]
MISFPKINKNSGTPKYIQVTDFLLKGIQTRSIVNGEQLPSLNMLCNHLDISKDTAEKAYRHLKEKELINAVPGKGYFIKSVRPSSHLHVFLLVNQLSECKRETYEHFARALGPGVKIDLQVYHNDFQCFEKCLEQLTPNYSHYVITTHFDRKTYADQFRLQQLLNSLPKDKLILLDKKVEGIKGAYNSIYQNFEKDIYQGLKSAADLLEKYQVLKLIFPAYSYQAREIINGFQNFCLEFGYRGKLVPKVAKDQMEKGDVYISLLEEDLVSVVQRIKTSEFEVGKEVGLISYHDSPLKSVLLDGITVFTTDFAALGTTAAELVLAKKSGHFENPFRLIVRNSL